MTGLRDAPRWVRMLVLVVIIIAIGAVVSVTGYVTRGFQHQIASSCQLDTSISLVYVVYTLGSGRSATAQSSFGSPIQTTYLVSRSGRQITIRNDANSQVVCQFVRGS